MNCVRVKWVTDRGPIISVTINLEKVAAKTIKLHKRYRYMYILQCKIFTLVTVTGPPAPSRINSHVTLPIAHFQPKTDSE